MMSKELPTNRATVAKTSDGGIVYADKWSGTSSQIR